MINLNLVTKIVNSKKMKNLILTGLLSFAVVSLSFGQLKVIAPDGDVRIGDVSGIPANKLDKLNVEGKVVAEVGFNVGSVANFDVAQTAAGKQTTFGHNGIGKFLLRTFQAGSDIQILGKKSNGTNQTYFMGKANGNVGIGTNDPQSNLHLAGNTARKGSAGMWVGPSDGNLKTNVAPYVKGLESVLKLNPVTYNYNGKGGIEDTETTHVGLIAQEYQKVAPDAISKFKYRASEEIESEDGGLSYKYGPEEEYLGIDPTQVMYMLVNAVKEQQKTITALQEEVKSMKSIGAASNSTPVNQISLLIEGNGSDKALLAQNAPNPFTSNTKIEYYIPKSVSNAVMSFTDITGKEIKSINIDKNGAGSLDVSIKEMPIGIYSYSLITDGQTIATKKMVLSR